MESHAKVLPLIVRTYFTKTVLDDGNFIEAQCDLCIPKQKIIRGQHKAPSNFVKHVQRVHGEKFVKSMHEKNQAQRKRPAEDLATEDFSLPKKSRIDALLEKPYTPVSKEKIDKLIVNFIVSDLLPLSTIEGDGFRTLMNCLAPNVTIMCRSTLKSKLADKFKLMLECVKAKLGHVPYVCTTADIWTQQARSYMGVTCHWIHKDTFARESAVLAFRRFTGTHSYDKIAAMLSSIHSEFDLEPPKITHVVTDNASNFVKAFKEYEEPNETQLDAEDSGDFMQVDVCDKLSAESANSTQVFYLPPHMRCFSHTLNLVAKTDALKTLQRDSQYKRLYRSLSGKCSALSNASHQSSKAAEIVKETLGKIIPKPTNTRWNSEVDCFHRVFEMQHKINTTMEQLQLPKFPNPELDFLGEWLQVMSPIATALDKLQGESNTESHMGAVLPTLTVLLSKLDAITSYNTANLVWSLKEGLKKRFEHILAYEENRSQDVASYVIAAVSHPFFKLRWIQNPEKKKIAEELFLQAVLRHDDKPIKETLVAKLENDHDFYGFYSDGNTATTSNAKILAMQFLADPAHDMLQLKRYPCVAAVFVQYNTTIPSSAPVERLFSCAGQILLPRRNRLEDELFQILLLLKKNAKFM